MSFPSILLCHFRPLTQLTGVTITNGNIGLGAFAAGSLRSWNKLHHVHRDTFLRCRPISSVTSSNRPCVLPCVDLSYPGSRKNQYSHSCHRESVNEKGSPRGNINSVQCMNYSKLTAPHASSEAFCTFQKTRDIAKFINSTTHNGKCRAKHSSASGKAGSTLKKSTKKAKQVKESIEETVREWKEDMVLTVPNALTSLRIALTPIIGYLVVHESYSWACGLFVVAGLTDLLDGYIARNFPGQASAFGSYLDPLADKLLVSVLFVSLSIAELIPLPLTVLVISRDVILISAAFYIRYMTLPPPKTLKRYFDITHATAQLHPTLISKLNTAVQLFMVTASLGAPVFGYVDHSAIHALWYLTAGTTIASGITYMFAKDTFKLLRQTRKKNI